MPSMEAWICSAALEELRTIKFVAEHSIVVYFERVLYICHNNINKRKLSFYVLILYIININDKMVFF